MATLASGKLSEMFEDFLKSVEDRNGNPVYRGKISQLISSEGKSLVVDFGDLLKYNNDLANRVLLEPDSSLGSFRIAAFETMRSENALYADRVKSELTVRLRGLPDLVPLRKVDTSYIDHMIAVSGMVVRTSELRPLMTEAAWQCPSGHLTFELQDDLALKRPAKCELCGEIRNFELDKKHSRFIDFQVVRVQELPEELPPGQLPQFFDVNIEGDIVNMARPGDRVVLTGIVRAVPDYALGQVRTRLFRSQIDCNQVEVKGKEQEQVLVTKEDEDLIKKIAASPDAYDRLVNSIAPVILGHTSEKEAILLLLAGGSATVLPDGTKLRGDINALFVGDPGTGKSEMLKFASQVAPRGLYASGRGTTAAGLSAAVIREKNVLMLEAGVVVLADQGIACVAEDTELYTGRSLMKIQKVWEEAAGPTYLTRTGREAKRILFPVSIYDRKQRADLPGTAFALMRKRHQGEVVKLTFGSGLSLKVTPEHLLKRPTDVKNLWIRADQVRVGDELKAPVRVYGPAAHLSYTLGEAYAIGCVYGDGWQGPSSITISQSKGNADVVRTIVERMPSTFAVYDKGDRQRQLGKYVLISRMMQLYTSERDFIRKTQLLLRSPSVDNILMLREDALWAFLAGIFDTDGDVNHSRGKIVSLRLYPTKNEHELTVLLYALRRLGIYARIYGKRSSIPVIQISGGDITRFAVGIGPYSVKLRREPEEIVIRHKGRRSIERGRDRVVAVERIPYDGYVYDLSVGAYHNYEAGLVYVHNCIDEFEKMKPEDRTALHEMMEQQSYHPLNEIMLADGAKHRIGELVEGIFRDKQDEIVEGKDCELVPLSGELKVMSTSPGGRTDAVEVDRVSRHSAPDHFFKIEYSNGRSIVVTPEHPVFVYKGGRITTVPAAEVAINDFAPAPMRLEAENPTPRLVEVESTPGSKAILQQKAISPGLGRVLGYLVTEGNFYRGRTAETNIANYDRTVLADMQAGADRIFGVAPTPGYRDGKQITVRYLSKTLLDWFDANFPEMVAHARRKRIPKAILGGPYDVAREFLRTAYLGDGSLESEAVCYRTASSGLAEDYEDLLLRLGISSRINFDSHNDSYKVYITGDSLKLFFDTLVAEFDPRHEDIKALVERSERHNRSHDVLPSELVTELVEMHGRLGIPYDGRYWEHQKDGYGVTRKLFMADLETFESKQNEIVLALESPRSLREIREIAGWSQERVARISGLSRKKVAYFESGGYTMEARKDMQGRIRASIQTELSSIRSKLSELRRLTSFRYLRVKSVKKVANRGKWKTDWVYDVTVEPTHNFISNGLILHNTVTIAKGGIYATLNARTAILAACNPVLGRYNPFQNLIENIGTLPIPLLTRFDVIFVFRDQPSPAEDERLATHILAVHSRRSYTTPPPIEFSLLKKYLTYSKRVTPSLTKGAVDRLREFYLELRKNTGAEDSIPPTPRTLEAMVRIASARARVLLRDEVTEEDALAAIALMNRMVEDVLTDATTKKTDFGIQLGKPVGETKNLRAAIEVLKALEGPDKKPVERKILKEELVKAKFSDEDAEKMIRTMFREGVVYESKPGFIRRLGG